MEYILEMKGIRKSFPGVLALEDVDFRVRPGEIHALMGENGAGKSTLIKILTGVYGMDAGEILLGGQAVKLSGTLDAQNLGISTVYQELNMIPHLSVAENIYLGRYPKRPNGMIHWKRLFDDARELLRGMGLKIDARRTLSGYGTATQQMVSIARAISLRCKIIVLDEPTSSLDTAEVKVLFDLIARLKAQGIAVIFISHRLDEVFEISDSISILKDGRHEGTYAAAELSRHELINKMIGREVGEGERTRREGKRGEECIVELENACLHPKLRGVSLKVRKGEIVGLAGLLGSGRTETAQVIFGYHRLDAGALMIRSRRVQLHSPKDGVKRKLAFCTENRREEGIVPNMSVRDNILLSSLPGIEKLGFVDRRAGARVVDEYIARLRIKTPSPDQKLKNLSGGNQQKVILARWLATNPDFIIFDEPTRGIDVGAKKEVEALIAEIADMGIGVLFISSEMPELMRNCDRIYVLRDGRVAGEVEGEAISQSNITAIIARGAADGGQ